MNIGIVTHGGADTTDAMSDGAQRVAEVGRAQLADGKTALDAVVFAVRVLEDDGRYCAGKGAVCRSDQETVQLDAACMRSDGEFGAVCAVETVEHPIDLARVVFASPHILLAGRGAEAMARQHGFPLYKHVGRQDLRPGCDTVGAVAFDGREFAAALSTGGVRNASVGRVGDVPMLGCGLYAGPLGAVAVTGDGEDIAKALLAVRCYDRLALGQSPQSVVEWALKLLPAKCDVGLILQTKTSSFAGARGGMAVGRCF